MQLGGPIWADAIHDGEFVRGLLSSAKATPSGTYHTLQRINGLLTVISEVWVCTHTCKAYNMLRKVYACVHIICIHAQSGCGLKR